ncbi:MAG: AMP-binding protein [Planctomycetota bacterium]
MAALRRGTFERADRLAWDDDASLGAEGIGIDSLELTAVAAAVSDFFCLHETGDEDRLFINRDLPAWASLCTAGPGGEPTHIEFRTSGSTGTPKRVQHARAMLLDEAAWFASQFAGAQRVISLVPSHHMFGFVHTVLVPQTLGVPVLDREFSPRSSVVRTLRAGDHIVATPFAWRQLLDSGLTFADGVTGVSSGETIDDDTWLGLLDAGLDELTDIYGATETGALGVRTQPCDAFTALNAQRARSAAVDHLDWLGDDTFMVAARHDAAVQIGGVNVSIEHVRSVLSSHEGVRDCSVRLVDNANGPRLAAFVVPSDDAITATELQTQLRAHAAASLDAPARPTSYTFGAELPRSALGKHISWEAAA